MNVETHSAGKGVRDLAAIVDRLEGRVQRAEASLAATCVTLERTTDGLRVEALATLRVWVMVSAMLCF